MVRPTRKCSTKISVVVIENDDGTKSRFLEVGSRQYELDAPKGASKFEITGFTEIGTPVLTWLSRDGVIVRQGVELELSE